VRMRYGLFLLCCFLATSSVLKASDEPTSKPVIGFPQRLDEAYHYGRLKQFNKSIAAFEKLIETNPGEFIVYDLYAQTLDLKQDYSGAVAVYEKWSPHRKGNGPGNPDEVTEKISRLKKKQEFKALMEKAEPWDDAKVYGTVEFAVKSNVPKEYQDKILSQLSEIIRKERRLLEDIFGYSVEDQPYMKVFIAGRLEDYKKLLHEFNPDSEKVYRQGSYFSDSHGMIVFFDGDIDLTVLAHETAHHLIDHYIKNPSMLLNEGLAEYLAYKLTKEHAKTKLLNDLELMNWLYDQGRLGNVLDIFKIWRSYLDELAMKDFVDLKTYDRLDRTTRMFYLRAWTLIYFFIEGRDKFSSKFFKDYLAYEKNNPTNDYNTAAKFFEKNLTLEQVKSLDNKWSQFMSSITYDKI